MSIIDEKVKEIEKALIEIEQSNLSVECKKTILSVLKDTIFSLQQQKKMIERDINFVENGFSK